mmetsp:Transcript_23799/g.58351  ORF Transcript_23799/g.58351 Transcript_23799/m.58351 type:complete len:83 (+) Transcript_23799:194-442(+)
MPAKRLPAKRQLKVSQVAMRGCRRPSNKAAWATARAGGRCGEVVCEQGGGEKEERESARAAEKEGKKGKSEARGKRGAHNCF